MEDRNNDQYSYLLAVVAVAPYYRQQSTTMRQHRDLFLCCSADIRMNPVASCSAVDLDLLADEFLLIYILLIRVSFVPRDLHISSYFYKSIIVAIDPIELATICLIY